jgi:Pentapeptide repeats (8 copies)
VSEPNDVPGLAADIQAIITVIRRPNRSFDHREPESLDLQETNLSEADLYGADLREANLSKALLSKALLQGANLAGANLSGAILTQEQLGKTIGDKNTKLPPGLTFPAHWRLNRN